ncbi:unnamed protein product [Phytophthora lilii]|uniref:Gamma-glutamylcyclotransferase family protein n=1 Tax=Phytophthora lilii TaxID=2077276 RepID=A0A9W6WG57_9STRA|nr:unnamed protein product [Phytophthora lilii]
MTTYVFVYGTLKRGLFNYGKHLEPAIDAGKASFVAAARTSRADFCMVLDDKGFFPCLFRAKSGGCQVSGEVFRVDADTLAALDRLERVDDGWYRREEVAVELLDGQQETIKANVYLAPVSDDLIKLERISNYEPEMNAKCAIWFCENML